MSDPKDKKNKEEKYDLEKLGIFGIKVTFVIIQILWFYGLIKDFIL